MQRLKHFLVFVFAVLALSSVAYAADATVSGTVYATNGVTTLSNVKVVLKNSSIGFTREAVTNSDGEYTINGVPAAAGFEITAYRGDGTVLATSTGISVDVGDDKVIFPALREKAAEPVVAKETPTQPAPGTQPSATPTTPTPAPTQVAAAGPILAQPPTIRPDLKSTSISSVVNREQLKTLPLSNRNFLTLGLLAPNAHQVEAGSALAGATFSVSGSKPSSNNFLLDGVDNVASSSNQAIPFQVNEAIDQFRVTTGTAAAEFGRNQGGVVDVVTQRGTSRYHGSLFGYFSDESLNSNSPVSVYSNTSFARAAAYAGPTNAAAATYSTFFTDAASKAIKIKAPNTLNSLLATAGNPARFDPLGLLATNNSFNDPYNAQQFGANIGGPLKKDKLFFFGSFEGTLIDNPNPVFERVPTAADKNLSAITALLPASGAASATLANKILNLYPAGNVTAVPGVLDFFQGQAPNYTHVGNVLMRSDYSQSNNTKYTARYVGQLLKSLHDDSLPQTSTYRGNGAFRNAQNQSGLISQSHTFKNNWINDVRLSFTQFRVDDNPQDANLDASVFGLPAGQMPSFLFSGFDPRAFGARPGVTGAVAGWTDAFWSPNASGAANAPAIPSLDGLFPFARLGAPLSAPSRRRDTTSLAADSLSLSLGRHQLKLGVEHRYIQNVFMDAGLSRGYVVSNNIGEFTSDSETCIGCGDAFKKPSFDYAINQSSPYVGDIRSWAMAGFLQDTWKARPTITVNAGLRYEFFSQPLDTLNRLYNYDPLANGLIQQGSNKATLDPFGNVCGVTAPRLDLEVRAVPNGIQPWSCQGSGSANLRELSKNNFGPRLGVSWAPRGGNTVIRAGGGLFFDQTPAQNVAQLLQNRPSAINFQNPSILFGQNFRYGPINTTCTTQCGFGNQSLTLATGTIDPFRQSAAASPALYQLDTRGTAPYTVQFNGSVQQQLGRDFVAEFAYMGNMAFNQPVVTNSGFQNEWFCTNTQSFTSGGCDNFSYFPIFTLSNIGKSNYNSLMTRIRAVNFHGLRMNATYVFGKSLDNTSSGLFPNVTSTLFSQLVGSQLFGIGNPLAAALGQAPTGNFVGPGPSNASIATLTNCTSPTTCQQRAQQLAALRFAIAAQARVPFVDTTGAALTTTGARSVFTSRYLIPQDPLNFLADDYARSDYDVTHRFVMDYSYDLPFMKSSNVLGGWSVSGIVSAQSGQPYSIFAGPAFGEVNQRVNNASSFVQNNSSVQAITSGAAPSSVLASFESTCTGIYANELAPAFIFSSVTPQATQACIGSSGRNSFTGPKLVQVDLGVQKSFRLATEAQRLSFRAEFYNLFNNKNFYNPISAYSLDGVQTNPEFGQVKSAHDPRQIQLAVRFEF